MLISYFMSSLCYSWILVWIEKWDFIIVFLMVVCINMICVNVSWSYVLNLSKFVIQQLSKFPNDVLMRIMWMGEGSSFIEKKNVTFWYIMNMEVEFLPACCVLNFFIWKLSYVLIAFSYIDVICLVVGF